MSTPIHRALALLALLGLLLPACAGLQAGAASTPSTAIPFEAPTNPVAGLTSANFPSYYAPAYQQIIEKSRQERELIIYSTFGAENWGSVIELFQARYPWIKVTTQRLGAAQVFSEYKTRHEAGLRAADLLISPDPREWHAFMQRGDIAIYRSQEELFLPIWATQNIGLYPLAVEPLVLVYNREQIATPPQNLAALAEQLAQAPGSYAQKISLPDPRLDPLAYAIYWKWLQAEGEAGWEQLAAISRVSPLLAPDQEALLRQIETGAISLGLFAQSSLVLTQMEKNPRLAYTYFANGQPILLTYMAISQRAASPNAARLMLDFILSQEGQAALALGQLMPYRSDIASIAPLHLGLLEAQVQTEHLLFITISPDLADPKNLENFLQRWDSFFPPLPTPQ